MTFTKLFYICKSARQKVQSTLSAVLHFLKQELRLRKDLELKYDWSFNARASQRMPQEDWFIWLILAGRGFGKTRTGAESIRELVANGQYKRIALVGETYDQIQKVMIEGESGILNIYPEKDRPEYISSKNQIKWNNGAIATCYSAESYEALRGPQFDLVWIDELAKFDHDQEVWDQIMFALRLGNPKLIITTTPRSKPLIKTLLNREDIIVTTGSTLENHEHLSPTFLKNILADYKGTKLGQQEIYGQVLDLNDGQLWRSEYFQYQKIDENLIKKMHIIIAIDPAMTTNSHSDETGIIVVGRLDNKYYVLEDASGVLNCMLWMHKVNELAQKYSPKQIVVETNQGGDILMRMLHKENPNLNYKKVHAKENKYTRAIPIASLYEQKKVIHANYFKDLEEQLLNAHVKFKDDRRDALTWGIYQLSLQNEHYHKFVCWS